MRAIEVTAVHAVLMFSLARASAQPAPELIQQLEAKIAQTPALPIDLANAVSAAAAGQIATPVAGAVVPASSKLKPGEARFVALSREDDASLAGFVLNAPEAPIRIFRGAIRTITADTQPVTLKAVALARGPMQFNAQSGRFEGHLGIGLIAITPGGATKLAAPIVFQVLGDITAIPPNSQVDHVAPPYEDVLVTSAPPARAIEVKVVSGVAPENVSLTFPVTPAIRVRAKPARIQGWGIEVADVSVEILGPREGVRALQLSSSRGRLAETALQIPTGVASVQLRSAGTGLATVSASGPGLAESRLEMEFAIPWRFMLAALLGGLLGAVVRQRLQTRWPELVVAVLGGALAALLYARGVAAFGLAWSATTGEIVTLVLAALAAYGGAELLVRARRLRVRA